MIEKTITNLDEITVFHKDPITVFELVPKRESPDMSIALIVLDGINKKVRNLESDAMYMVVNGFGCFILWDENGHEVREVTAGDCVHIPAGTAYQDVGRMTMVSINHKAFDPGQVEFLD